MVDGGSTDGTADDDPTRGVADHDVDPGECRRVAGPQRRHEDGAGPAGAPLPHAFGHRSGTGVRPGRGDQDRRHLGERVEDRLHLGDPELRVGGRRMVRAQHHPSAQRHVQILADRLEGRARRVGRQPVEAGGAGHVHPPRLFPHAPYSGRVDLVRAAVQVRELRDGVAHRVVDRTGGELAAVEVHDRHPQHRGGPRRRQRLVAVAEQAQYLHRPFGRRLGQGGGATGCGRDERNRGVVGGGRGDLLSATYPPPCGGAGAAAGWAMRDSNPRPLPCEGSALTI